MYLSDNRTVNSNQTVKNYGLSTKGSDKKFSLNYSKNNSDDGFRPIMKNLTNKRPGNGSKAARIVYSQEGFAYDFRNSYF